MMDPLSAEENSSNHILIASRFNHRASTPKNELFALAGDALSLVPFEFRDQILQQLPPDEVYGISCNTIFQLDVSDEQRRSMAKLWEKAVNISQTQSSHYVQYKSLNDGEHLHLHKEGERRRNPISSR